MSGPSLLPGHEANFRTLARAFGAGDVALVACTDATTGELVPTICAVQRHRDGTIEMVPFARLFDGNPYEQIAPPQVDDDVAVVKGVRS